jgi:hypothetical protein
MTTTIDDTKDLDDGERGDYHAINAACWIDTALDRSGGSDSQRDALRFAQVHATLAQAHALAALKASYDGWQNLR